MPDRYEPEELEPPPDLTQWWQNRIAARRFAANSALDQLHSFGTRSLYALRQVQLKIDEIVDELEQQEIVEINAKMIAANPPPPATGSADPNAAATIRYEYVSCGKCKVQPCRHGPYAYSYRRVGERVVKKYIGKVDPQQ